MVNEEKVDLLLEMLRSADVTDASQDESKTLKELESEEGGREGPHYPPLQERNAFLCEIHPMTTRIYIN